MNIALGTNWHSLLGEFLSFSLVQPMSLSSPNDGLFLVRVSDMFCSLKKNVFSLEESLSFTHQRLLEKHESLNRRLRRTEAMKGAILSTGWIRGSRIFSNSQVVIRYSITSVSIQETKVPCVWTECVLTDPLTNVSHPIHFPLLRYPLPPLHLVCVRLWTPPALALSHSPHRHPFLCIPPSSRLIRYNKSSPARLTG